MKRGQTIAAKKIAKYNIVVKLYIRGVAFRLYLPRTWPKVKEMAKTMAVIEEIKKVAKSF